MGRLVVASLLLSSGCALSASALANHNSGGRACISSSAFGLIDIAAAGLSAAAISASDASLGWYAVPGLLGASGLLGVISAARCNGDSEAAAQNAPPASNTAPSFGEAPVDPDARNATREELGLAPDPNTPPPSLRLDRNGLPSTLPPPPTTTPPPPTPTIPVVTQEPKPKPPTAPTAPACTLSPRKDCPDGYYCSLVEENTGTCIKIE